MLLDYQLEEGVAVLPDYQFEESVTGVTRLSTWRGCCRTINSERVYQVLPDYQLGEGVTCVIGLST